MEHVDTDSMIKDIKKEDSEQTCRQTGTTDLDLKAVREARGLTLTDVHHQTRVSMTNLEALENSQFHLLPIPLYTRGFIKGYAQVIGIDASPILDRYQHHLDATNTPRTSEVPAGKSLKRQSKTIYKTIVWTSSLLVITTVLIFALSSEHRDPGIPQNNIAKPSALPPLGEKTTISPEVLKNQTEPGMINPVLMVDSASPPAAPAAGGRQPTPAMAATGQVPAHDARNQNVKEKGAPYRLVMEARELTWIRVTQDQLPPYQILLKPGDKVERVASQVFILDIGNAGGVSVIFQGKSLGELGDKGQVLHLRLPPGT